MESVMYVLNSEILLCDRCGVSLKPFSDHAIFTVRDAYYSKDIKKHHLCNNCREALYKFLKDEI